LDLGSLSGLSVVNVDLLVHPALWRTAAPERAADWRRVLEEFNVSRARGLETVSIEIVELPELGVAMRVGEEGALVTLPGPERDRHFADYGETIAHMVRLDREAPVRGFEALDYAKRTIHDEAAGWLIDVLRPVAVLDLPVARRLFTMLFLVASDLPEELVRYHRRH
jgi:hypothetical protein